MKKTKKLLLISLLTVFIIGPAISSASAQTQNKSPLIQMGVSGDSGRGVYCYDSLEVKKIAELILENDMLKENGKEYELRDSLCSLKQELLRGKVMNLERIINFKDEQLQRLENIPLAIKQTGWKWWHYTLACIGAVTFGFTAGVIYENLK